MFRINCFSPLSRPTDRPAGATVALAWVWRSQLSWSMQWGVRLVLKARRTRVRASISRCHSQEEQKKFRPWVIIPTDSKPKCSRLQALALQDAEVSRRDFERNPLALHHV